MTDNDIERRKLREDSECWDKEGLIIFPKLYWEWLETALIQAREELDKLHTWKGLMSLLDEHYPSDIFTGESGDVGAMIIVLTRELSKCREELENANGLCHELGATCCKQEIEILRLKDYNKKALELANRVEGECDEYINKLNKCREELAICNKELGKSHNGKLADSNFQLTVLLEKCREENERIVADAKQCHKRNDELVKEHLELGKEPATVKADWEEDIKTHDDNVIFLEKELANRQEKYTNHLIDLNLELDKARERIKNISSLLKFFADRLIYHYDEDTNMDYIIKAYSLIKELEGK